MNGAEYDKILENMENARNIAYSNPLQFCKFLIDLTNQTRAFRYLDKDTRNLDPSNEKNKYGRYRTISNDEDYNRLKYRVAKEKIDEEGMRVAHEIFSSYYEFYSSQLAKKIRSYELAIKREISKYKTISKSLLLLNYTLQTIVILGATSIPFILLITQVSKVVPIIISCNVAVASALCNYYKFRERRTNLYYIAEKMQQEYDWYISTRGLYRNISKGAALDFFMDKIDEIRQEKRQTYMELEKKIQDQVIYQEQNIDKLK